MQMNNYLCDFVNNYTVNLRFSLTSCWGKHTFRPP